MFFCRNVAIPIAITTLTLFVLASVLVDTD